jgi:signal transduction histidine kinase
MKHGKAQRVIVALARSGGTIRLSIRDDGTGIPKTGNKSNGIGLRVMNYRAGMIGATLNIESQPTGGTSVTCQLQDPEPAKATPSKTTKTPKASRTAARTAAA